MAGIKEDVNLPLTTSKIKRPTIDITNKYSRISCNRDYKNAYKHMPIKISSTNFLEVYVLHVLSKHKEPIYALEILNSLSEICTNGMWKPSHGTLYPLLNTMYKKGYIDITVKKTNKTGKKYYTITDAGLDILDIKKGDLKSIVAESELFFRTIYRELYV